VDLYFYSTKQKFGSKYLSLTWCDFEHQVGKIFTNTVMQGMKQSNAKKQRKIGALRWLAGHDFWPPGPGQIHKSPSQLYNVCGDTWS
jgi:hypothetical protein